jgi:uncharacterized protein YjiS (DUF1127 family)
MTMTIDVLPSPLPTDRYLRARSHRGNAIRHAARALATAMRKAWAMFGHWSLRRRTVRELQMLEDHRLADIGIRRADIETRLRMHGG